MIAVLIFPGRQKNPYLHFRVVVKMTTAPPSKMKSHNILEPITSHTFSGGRMHKSCHYALLVKVNGQSSIGNIVANTLISSDKGVG